MNIEQLKRNNLEEHNNVKYFTDTLSSNKFYYGPSGLSELLTEAFLSSDESFSVQAWFSIMGYLSICNTEFGEESFSKKMFMDNKRVKGYIRLIKDIFKSFHDKEIILPFFVNQKKWQRKIMNELETKFKIVMYAMDSYLSSELKDFGYSSMNNALKEESFKVKTMVSSYCAFMNGE